MFETNKRAMFFAVLITLSLAACGCPAKKDKPVTAYPRTANNTMESQKRFDTRMELRNYIASKIVCPIHNNDLLTDEKLNPGCPARSEFMTMVDRMIDTGWTLDEIEASLRLLNQGKSMMEPIPGAKSCSPGDGRLKLDFFLMSHCPYGMRYTEQILPVMLGELGQNIEWTPHFIVDFQQDGKIHSLHGQPEVEEDQYQICIARETGINQWLGYSGCYSREVSKARVSQPKTGGSDPNAGFKAAREACLKSNNIDAVVVRKCVDSNSIEYLRQDAALTNRWNVKSSPGAVFNCSAIFNGGAMPYDQAKPQICALYGDRLPDACKAASAHVRQGM
jgi:hypothetical protein